jgi:hypothetical protein
MTKPNANWKNGVMGIGMRSKRHKKRQKVTSPLGNQDLAEIVAGKPFDCIDLIELPRR